MEHHLQAIQQSTFGLRTPELLAQFYSDELYIIRNKGGSVAMS